MNTPSILILAFGLTVVLSLFAGGRWRRSSNSIVSFFWGDNSFSATEAAHLNISTSFSLNGIVFSAWLGYRAGIASLLPQLIWCAGFIFMSKYANRLSALARSGTLHGNISTFFTPFAGICAAIASVVGFTTLFGWELAVGASVFRTLTPAVKSLDTVMYFSLAGIAAAYCMLGGLRGNMRANKFQNYLAAAALLVAIVYLSLPAQHMATVTAHDLVDGSTITSLLDELTLAGVVSNISFIIYQFVDMSMWENIASVDNTNEKPKRSLVLAGITVFFLPGVVGTWLGMLMRSVHQGVDANTILPQLLHILEAQPLLLFLISMGCFAAMLSTVDGILLAAAQSLTWDIIDKETVNKGLERLRFHKTENDDPVPGIAINDDSFLAEKERKVLNHAVYGIFAIAFLGGALVLLIRDYFHVDVFNMIYVAFVGQYCLFPVVWTMIHDHKKPKQVGAISIISGLGGGLAFLFYSLITNPSNAVWSPIVALAFASILWLPFPKRRQTNSIESAPKKPLI